MLRTVTFMLLGVAGGLAAATLLVESGEPRPEPSDLAGPVGALSQSEPDPLAERVAVLEAALESEIEIRERLQRELAALGERLAVDDRADVDERRDGARGDLPGEGLDPAALQERFAARAGFGRRDDPAQRQARLVEAGFSAADAQRITEREAALQLEALYAQYDAVRSGEPVDFRDRFAAQDQLRQELGDPGYERYLEATGQTTAVGIRQVMAGSAGETAGLVPGDEIVAYAGERVFDTGDLNRLTLEGTPGETVAVDVLRDGQQIQVYVPRGPIGITGGGFFGGMRGR